MTITAQQIKDYMNINDINLTDSQIGTYIEDAQTYELDDALSNKYLTCYILAKSVDWISIKKDNNVEFNKPNPQTYLQLLNGRRIFLGIKPLDLEQKYFEKTIKNSTSVECEFGINKNDK